MKLSSAQRKAILAEYHNYLDETKWVDYEDLYRKIGEQAAIDFLSSTLEILEVVPKRSKPKHWSLEEIYDCLLNAHVALDHRLCDSDQYGQEISALLDDTKGYVDVALRILVEDLKVTEKSDETL